MSKYERIALAVLSAALVLSFALLLRMFYLEHTEEVPSIGGTYIEGSVGDVRSLNPWFTITNDTNRDIVSLVFAGLLKYDPETGEIVEDLATMEISGNGLMYTLRLKEGLYWHDTTEQDPHPVTAEDVLFTYQTIQDPEFPNALLRQNFRGVTIDMIDERTVRFSLEKPYAFFPSNLTLGLIPRRYFEGIPAARVEQVLDFGFHPIGCGPYAFVSLLQTDLSTEVTLKRFEKYPESNFKFERIVFRLFPDYPTLLSDISNLDAVRLVPRNEKGEPILPKGFRAIPYTLPQYVGLFFNLDRPIVQDHALRLGLQLATDKQSIVDALHESHIVDTPLLEIDLGDWRYLFDPNAAQGALFNSRWHLPEKVRLQRLQEWQDVNTAGAIRVQEPVVYLATGASLSFTGSMQGISFPAYLNGVRVETSEPAEGIAQTSTGTWIVRLGTDTSQTGSLTPGMNRIRLTDSNGAAVDTAIVDRHIDRRVFERAREEQRLLRLYMESRDNLRPEQEQIAIANLYLDGGYLRTRQPTDPPSVRINANGQPLRITLVTSPAPDHYPVLANIIKEQWRTVGVDVNVEVPSSRGEFEERLLYRNYDILLFGQSLLNNLDSYPYWHSSQIQESAEDRSQLKLDAFNLSQYASFEADALLSRMRETRDPEVRERALNDLNAILKRDIPAIFLYSPLYIYGYRESVSGVELNRLSLHSDKFLALSDWFMQTERRFKPGKGWTSFFGWLPTVGR